MLVSLRGRPGPLSLGLDTHTPRHHMARTRWTYERSIPPTETAWSQARAQEKYLGFVCSRRPPPSIC